MTNRSATPKKMSGQSNSRSQGNTKQPTSLWAKCFGNAEVTYTKETTDFLTDLTGIFLVFCFSIYFTVAVYLFYRETVLSS